MAIFQLSDFSLVLEINELSDSSTQSISDQLNIRRFSAFSDANYKNVLSQITQAKERVNSVDNSNSQGSFKFGQSLPANNQNKTNRCSPA
mmetsp:Transcript_4922/g.4543  ORF Transcript_4922/g.4543 Transcript_4922/m.4543 type:complete len:90 (-) Transcript_4922:151-420(-)